MIGSLIVFFLVLSVLILIHEIGHFLAARRAGVLVEEFGFGLPPRILGKKIGETLYSINALPFGGFVKLHGENSEDAVEVKSRAFINRPKLQRSLIIIAGVFMNFILAIVAFGIVYSFSGIPKPTGKVEVVDISSSSPAVTSGIIVGDIVTKVDKKPITKNSEFIDLIEAKKGQKVALEIEREVEGQKSTLNVTTTPRENPPDDEGPLGVKITDSEIYYPPVWQRPFYGIYYGFQDALFWGLTVITSLIKIFTDLFGGQLPKGLSGPVGIFAVTSEATKVGWLAVVNLVGILSVNLAILNILPFPALDGGRLLFIGIESVLGRKVLPKVESAVHTVGMVILLLIIFAITFNDIRALIQAGSISNFLDSMVK